MISLTESSARSTAAIVIGRFFFVLDWVDFGLRKWQRNVPLKAFTDVLVASAVVYSCRVPSSPLGETCVHVIGNEEQHDPVVARCRLLGFVEVINQRRPRRCRTASRLTAGAKLKEVSRGGIEPAATELGARDALDLATAVL